MGIGSSLFLATVGAILAFAVEVSSDVFDIQTAGTILMITGAVGLVLSIVSGTRGGGAGRLVPPPDAPRRRGSARVGFFPLGESQLLSELLLPSLRLFDSLPAGAQVRVRAASYTTP